MYGTCIIYNYWIPPFHLIPASFVQAISDGGHLALRVCSFLYMYYKYSFGEFIWNIFFSEVITELVRDWTWGRWSHTLQVNSGRIKSGWDAQNQVNASIRSWWQWMTHQAWQITTLNKYVLHFYHSLLTFYETSKISLMPWLAFKSVHLHISFSVGLWVPSSDC